MKATITKEQSTEIRTWLEKQRVPKDTIESLLNSSNAANTFKAYRMKKQIVTPDGWAIHFGANWARALEKSGDSGSDKSDDSAKEKSSAKAADTPKEKPAAKPVAKAESAADSSADNKKDIKTIGEDFLSRTFMGLAEKLKKLQVEDVDKPQMQKIAFEIDKDHLAMLKKYSADHGVTVGALIRRAIRELLEKV